MFMGYSEEKKSDLAYIYVIIESFSTRKIDKSTPYTPENNLIIHKQNA